MPNGGEILTKDKFLEEIIVLENRLDSKLSDVRSVFQDINSRLKAVEDKVLVHIAEEEVSHVDEEVEMVKERIYDPEKGVIVMQQSICAALEKLHEELEKSDKALEEKLKKQAGEFKKFKTKMDTKITSLQKTMWVVAASAAIIYLVDNPEAVFAYIQKFLSSAL